MLFPLILIVFFVVAPIVGRRIRNERFVQNAPKIYGTVTSSYPTGNYFNGIPQIILTLKYSIDGVEYEGCASQYTNMIYCLGTTVPIRVNPKNPVDCSIASTRWKKHYRQIRGRLAWTLKAMERFICLIKTGRMSRPIVPVKTLPLYE